MKQSGIKQLLDVRINNVSQLAGFTKRDDLEYFLQEICGASYIHQTLLAPTPELLSAYRKKEITWADYEERFLNLMLQRAIESKISSNIFDAPTVLLCSESTAEKCHRRLVLEYLSDRGGQLDIVHL